MKINSKIRQYEVLFCDQINIKQKIEDESFNFFIIDKNVHSLHSVLFENLDSSKILIIEANESNKSFESCSYYLNFLVSAGLKRGHKIAAIGGGVIQDIAGFVCSILFRGIDWVFFPTTLLAQCDSCIGGKTSINFLSYKNLLGNFNPPSEVFISQVFLETLSDDHVYSGLGEIVKISNIDSKQRIHYEDVVKSIKTVKVESNLIYKSLEAKKDIIELDEFDTGLRNTMNYGHTFGHAIESVTKYAVPHGIAVGIGISIANLISKKNNLISNSVFKILEEIDKTFLNANKKHVKTFLSMYNLNDYIEILSHDKKNTDQDNITCILPFGIGDVRKFVLNKKQASREISLVIEDLKC